MFEALQLVVIAAVSGLALRLALGIAGQRWATTYHNTMTYLLLPVIGMAITKTISGNIALSLGMIGALSIVRFRHPVKSPLELVIFFLLLTVGVTLTVDVTLGILLISYSIAMILLVHGYQIVTSKKGKSTFAISFSEGEPLHLLEVTSKNEIPELMSHSNLVMSSWREATGEYDYRVTSRSRDEIELLASTISQISGISRVELRLAQ